MSDVLRDAVIARRLNPDGELLEVGVKQVKTKRTNVYPWDTMKLGDFFFVPLKGQKYGTLQVRFRQAAARRDWELTVVTVDRDGEPNLRVCLTLTGVRALKEKALQRHGVPITGLSDGRWKHTRKRRNPPRKLPRRGRSKPRRAASAPRGTEAPPGVPETLGDASPAVGAVDETLSPSYDRAAVIKQRLKDLGVEQ